MAYEDFEESASSGQPVTLFLFRYSSQPLDYYAYTDADLKPGEVISVASIDYEPRPIARANFSQDGTLDKAGLKIETDVGTEVAELFRVWPPSSVVTLVIAEGHIGDPDSEFLVTWAGRIVAANRQKKKMVLTGEPVSTSLRRPGLRRHYQIGCMHQLYGPQCQADKPSKTVPATVDSITGATVTLDAGWNGAFAADKFLGGLLEWPSPSGATNVRTILRVTGDTLMLSGITPDLSPSDAVDVVVGCNHRAYAEDDGDCQPLHENILNYGGCRWIPIKNPIGTYNNYY